jgi:pyrroline-5-carboxylate reductase
MRITFIGGGNMASALIGGLIQKGFAANDIGVVEITPKSRERLEQQYSIRTYVDLSAEALTCEVVVLAVKPQQLHEVASDMSGLLHHQVVVSIAAGVRAGDLSRWLGNYPLLVRAMPNTPALVMAGITGLYALEGVNQIQRSQAGQVLEAVGEVIWLDDEAKMDGVTAISGSGPAYVFYFIEALQEVALELGFDDATARRLSLGTFLGATRLAIQSEEDTAVLRARVTSKGGTTERAIDAMEAAGIKASIKQAVLAAAERSRELGDQLGNK